MALPALGLVLCFAVGLAGGTLYKLWPEIRGKAMTLAQGAPKPAAPLQTAAGQTRDSQVAANQITVGQAATPQAAATQSPSALAAAPSAAPPFTAAGPLAAPAAPALADALPDQPATVPSAASSPADLAAASPAAHPKLALKLPQRKLQDRPALTRETQHLSAPPQAVALHPPAPVKTAAAKTASSKTSAVKAGSGPYRIQFGAFLQEDNARRTEAAVEATGMKIEVTQRAGRGGHTLFVLRSPRYDDYAAALSAAQSVETKIKETANPLAVDYAILTDRNAPAASPLQSAEIR